MNEKTRSAATALAPARSPGRGGITGSVYRGAAVLGRSNLGSLQRVGLFAGRIILHRFCARGRAPSAKNVPGFMVRGNRPVNPLAPHPSPLAC